MGISLYCPLGNSEDDSRTFSASGLIVKLKKFKVEKGKKEVNNRVRRK